MKIRGFWGRTPNVASSSAGQVPRPTGLFTKGCESSYRDDNESENQEHRERGEGAEIHKGF